MTRNSRHLAAAFAALFGCAVMLGQTAEVIRNVNLRSDLPGVPTTQNQARPNPPKSNPRSFLGFAKVEAIFINPNVRFCEELRGFSFGHIFGHVPLRIPLPLSGSRIAPPCR